MFKKSTLIKNETLLVIVAALGYFVDIYDLILFSIVRKQSLLSLGFSELECLTKGEVLIQLQMLGMLIGGIIWGVWGDKKGRLSVLFGSILMYSVANIANGMVETIEMYGVWRFIAGIGLAGELGAGITLVSESMSKENRGYGTMAVTSFGVLGGVFAGLISELFDWRMSYYIGGSMGLVLLLLRVGVFESGMYQKTKRDNIQMGNFLELFKNKILFYKYTRCIIIGLPTWFFAGILITFSPEFSKALGISEVNAGTSVIMFYGGLTLGDFVSGFMSQMMQSRKKVVQIFLWLCLISTGLYLFNPMQESLVFYIICFICGFSAGYWAIFVTIASEQFGTNYRATVTTTVPNFVRGALVPLLFLFDFFKRIFQKLLPDVFAHNIHLTLISSALLVGLICISLAYIALKGLQETYAKELDYIE